MKVGDIMSNVFNEDSSHNIFTWDKIGDVHTGRTRLGEEMPVSMYRVLEYTMNHVLTEEYGNEKANELFRRAGHLAGTEFAKNILDTSLEFDGLDLSQKLIDMKIGILRIEKFDTEDGSFVLTIGEDLDCSGLPITNEVVCNYDEGFLAGIMKEYTGLEYCVREIDCWASGDRVCRFKGKVVAPL